MLSRMLLARLPGPGRACSARSAGRPTTAHRRTSSTAAVARSGQGDLAAAAQRRGDLDGRDSRGRMRRDLPGLRHDNLTGAEVCDNCGADLRGTGRPAGGQLVPRPAARRAPRRARGAGAGRRSTPDTLGRRRDRADAGRPASTACWSSRAASSSGSSPIATPVLKVAGNALDASRDRRRHDPGPRRRCATTTDRGGHPQDGGRRVPPHPDRPGRPADRRRDRARRLPPPRGGSLRLTDPRRGPRPGPDLATGWPVRVQAAGGEPMRAETARRVRPRAGVRATLAIVDLTARAYDPLVAIERGVPRGARVLAVGQHDDARAAQARPRRRRRRASSPTASSPRTARATISAWLAASRPSRPRRDGRSPADRPSRRPGTRSGCAARARPPRRRRPRRPAHRRRRRTCAT